MRPVPLLKPDGFFVFRFLELKGGSDYNLFICERGFIMEYVYKPKGVCSMEIKFELEGDVVKNISFLGGCDGNLHAIAKLCEGMKASEVADKLEGNDCRGRGTSCADQLSRGLREAIASQKA